MSKKSKGGKKSGKGSRDRKKLATEPFRVRPGQRLRLERRNTDIPKLYRDDDDAKQMLEHQVRHTSELQDILYAGDRYALLLIFQAMDAAGKDGAIKHVMSGVNPQGCQVVSFKQPSTEELDHDFLWRTALHLPERGRIGIFNRSYYEEVLVVRVHPEYLSAQRLPDADAGSAKFWKGRMRSIRDHEAHLHRNGTQVVKFFLHVSFEEQRRRFLDRIDHPDKNWKFNRGDVEERGHWQAYMRAYEEALSTTSTPESPWFVIPADDKLNARLLISQVINDTLEAMHLRYPELNRARLAELKAARRLLGK